jgi:hypothetical protein
MPYVAPWLAGGGGQQKKSEIMEHSFSIFE